MGAASISAPKARGYLTEMQGALAAQGMINPELLAMEARWIPEWQKLQERTLRGQMGTLQNLYGEAIPAAARLSQQQVDAMSPVMRNIGMQAQDAYRSSLGPAAGLLSTMQSQAASELALGRTLSPEEQRIAEQSARAAMQARGLQGGNQAVAAEVLNSYNLGSQREAQRRAYASGVYGLSEASAANAYNQYGSPLMQMTAATSPSAMLAGASSMSQGLGPSMFNPESSYNAALITANRKEQMDAQMFNAQQQNAMTSGLIGGVASLGGAFLGGPAFASMMGATTGLTGATKGLSLGQTTGMLTSGLQNSSFGQAAQSVGRYVGFGR